MSTTEGRRSRPRRFRTTMGGQRNTDTPAPHRLSPPPLLLIHRAVHRGGRQQDKPPPHTATPHTEHRAPQHRAGNTEHRAPRLTHPHVPKPLNPSRSTYPATTPLTPLPSPAWFREALISERSPRQGKPFREHIRQLALQPQTHAPSPCHPLQ